MSRRPVHRVLVRYGGWSALGEMTTRDRGLAPGDAVVVRTARGREWAEVLAPPEPEPQPQPEATLEPGAGTGTGADADAGAGGAASGAAAPGPVPVAAAAADGEVLRRASAADRARRWRLEAVELPEAYARSREAIARADLPLDLVGLDLLFGGERGVAYVEVRGGARSEAVRWSVLADALRAALPGTRIEIREVGEEVRAKEQGCGRGGGCGREECAARARASEATAASPASPAAPPAVSGAARGLPLPGAWARPPATPRRALKPLPVLR